MTVRCLVLVKGTGWQVKSELLAEIEASNQLKSLILAQIERWRHALHMQVERARGQLLVSGERVSNASERAP